MKSRVQPQSKLLFTVSQWSFFFFFATVVNVPNFYTRFLCGKCLNYTLAHPSNPNYLRIVSREYNSKWSSGLSSPLVPGYAFEGPRDAKAPAALLDCKEKASRFTFPLCRLFLYQKAWREANVDSQQPAQTKPLSLLLCCITSVKSEGLQLPFSALVHVQPPTHP